MILGLRKYRLQVLIKGQLQLLRAILNRPIHELQYNAVYKLPRRENSNLPKLQLTVYIWCHPEVTSSPTSPALLLLPAVVYRAEDHPSCFSLANMIVQLLHIPNSPQTMARKIQAPSQMRASNIIRLATSQGTTWFTHHLDSLLRRRYKYPPLLSTIVFETKRLNGGL